MDASVPGETAQHGLAGSGRFGGFPSAAAGWNCCGSGSGRRRLDTFGRAPLAVGTAVHGVVSQLIGCLVLMAESMADFEAIQLCDAATRLFPEGAQIGRIYLVFALNLLHHEFGIGNYPQAAVAMVEHPLQTAEQTGIFSVVIGAIAEKLGQFCEDDASLILEQGSIAGRPGIAAGSAITVGDDPAGLAGGSCFVGKEACGGTDHPDKFTASGERFWEGCLRLQQAFRLSRCSYPDSGVRNNMSSSDAIVLAGEGRRRPSPFSLGLTETAAISAVKSTVMIPNVAAQPGTRTKLTAEQMDARQQQRAEDDELIRAAQKGDRQAFDSLVRRYDRSVLRLALHMLGNEQDAQDVHQEAFLKAYRHLSNFRFECSFYTWLYRIVTNLCLDQLRRRKSRREDPATALDGTGDEIDLLANLTDGRASANPARELERKTMHSAIQGALEELTPRERTVFELKHYQGLKLRTIGEMLSTTEETAKNTLFRATRKLRARLADAR